MHIKTFNHLHKQALIAFIATCTAHLQLLQGSHLLFGKLDKVIFRQQVQLRAKNNKVKMY